MSYLVYRLRKVRTSINGKKKKYKKNQLNELLCVLDILMDPLRISGAVMAVGLKCLKTFLIGIYVLTY